MCRMAMESEGKTVLESTHPILGLEAERSRRGDVRLAAFSNPSR